MANVFASTIYHKTGTYLIQQKFLTEVFGNDWEV